MTEKKYCKDNKSLNANAALAHAKFRCGPAIWIKISQIRTPQLSGMLNIIFCE